MPIVIPTTQSDRRDSARGRGVGCAIVARRILRSVALAIGVALVLLVVFELVVERDERCVGGFGEITGKWCR